MRCPNSTSATSSTSRPHCSREAWLPMAAASTRRSKSCRTGIFFCSARSIRTFHFEPRQTFEWRVDLGTSGTGVGGNKDPARFARFRDAIYAKWSARRNALAARVKQLVEDAATKLRHGDFDGAEARCREALAASPGDPWALNTLALVYRAGGRWTMRSRRRRMRLPCVRTIPRCCTISRRFSAAAAILPARTLGACSGRSTSRRTSPLRRTMLAALEPRRA